MDGHTFRKVLHFFVRYQPLALVASLVLLTAPLRAASDDRQVYAGTVGAAQVVVELEGSGDNVTGRYFYRKYRLDIGLSGRWTGDRLLLEARSSGDQLNLHRAGAELAGSLTTKAGRTLPVRLSPVAAPAPLAAGLSADMADLSPYERHQLAGLSLVPGSIRQDGPRALRDWREPVSGITLFRIESGYPAPVLARINAALERQQWERVSQWFGCEGFGGQSGMDVSEARAPYLSDDFVSYAWFASWSCAGTAHPDFGTQGVTFDTRTGRELQLEDLLYFGNPPAPQPGTPAFFDYRGDIFAPRIVSLLGQLYPNELQPADGEAAEDQCDYADTSVWDFPSWYLTGQGLYLGAYFARAQRPCDEPDWSVIPWQHLTWHKGDDTVPHRSAVPTSTLHFGQREFARDDIASVALDFDHRNFPVLDITLRPEAAQHLEAESIRLLNTDVAITVGDKSLSSARLVEPIAEGRIRISGRFSLTEVQGMARQIICAMHLGAEQYDSFALSDRPVCEPPAAPEAQGAIP